MSTDRITPIFTLRAGDKVKPWQYVTLLCNCSPLAAVPDANPFFVYDHRHLHHLNQRGECLNCGFTVSEILWSHIQMLRRLRFHPDTFGRCPGHVCDGDHPGAGLFYAGEPDPLPVNDNHPYTGVIDVNRLLDGDAISRQRTARRQPQEQTMILVIQHSDQKISVSPHGFEDPESGRMWVDQDAADVLVEGWQEIVGCDGARPANYQIQTRPMLIYGDPFCPECKQSDGHCVCFTVVGETDIIDVSRDTHDVKWLVRELNALPGELTKTINAALEPLGWRTRGEVRVEATPNEFPFMTGLVRLELLPIPPLCEEDGCTADAMPIDFGGGSEVCEDHFPEYYGGEVPATDPDVL